MAKKIQLTEQLSRKYAPKRVVHKPHFVVSRILVVCEGIKTEPNYFKSFNKKNNGVFVVELNFSGGGINTIQVVDEAIRLKEKAERKKQPYDIVWAVFDRDSFNPGKFNAAIIKAEANNIECAWSNEAFELWYLLHFEYRNTGMNRADYCGKIEQHINASPLYNKKKPYKYKKNDEAHYDEMSTYGNIERALDNAEKLDALYNDECYANHNPRTLVYKLVRLLLGRDKDFNNFIKEKMY